MLMKEKFKTEGDTTLNTDAKKLLGHKSEREEIEMLILRKLTDITESSPEFAQVVDMTGTKDRYKQAEKLAADVYDKIRAEELLKFYTPSDAQLRGHFKARTLPSAVARAAAVAQLPGETGGVAAGVIDALLRAVGART